VPGVVVIDYGSGNLRSAAKAIERAARESAYAGPVTVTADPDQVRTAERIVLPGVGAFADCMAGINGVPGLREVLEQEVIRAGKPFLGICVGMQLMARVGHEHGHHPGFGWIDGEVVPFGKLPGDLKVPHMGWNDLRLSGKGHPLLAGLTDGMHAYFVHSYHLQLANPAQELASVEYGGHVTAMVGRDNLAGTQFHPEKSQALGLRLIANFLHWRP
jgi:glutamine amidotransferase